MPLIKIDLIRGVRSMPEIKKIADVVQEIMLAKFRAPPRDRYQIITQHEEGEIIFEDTGLNFERTNKIVFIQIFQQGRTAEMKMAIYKDLAKRLHQECDVPPTDLMVSCNENTKADWSFGMGRAQFLEGDL
ncbi:Tautomerase/MIF superfamily [Phaffia rhodozyma]|uniref:Tautomerase/MIF superfamily n=1 Tax=Phaffia rhodozyma TaxID=264483 RepID=A0A0F7SGU9_PHARH|nr:Tautomerase/MIF superfamily [Phaffia rhodozyma]